MVLKANRLRACWAAGGLSLTLGNGPTYFYSEKAGAMGLVRRDGEQLAVSICGAAQMRDEANAGYNVGLVVSGSH